MAGGHVGGQPGLEHGFDRPGSTRARDREQPPEELDVLVPRQVEVEAPVDRTVARVPMIAVGAGRLAHGILPELCQRLCQTLWQSQADTGSGIAFTSRCRRWP
jgi:hypothetical protein